MKKKLTVLTFFCLCLIFLSNTNSDEVTLKHSNYTSLYSVSKHYPLKVEWWETKLRDGCKTPLPRKDKFGPDPLLIEETNIQNYYNSANLIHKKNGLNGFDRGHMCPAASNECQTQNIEDECFYFSNMSAQYHSLNAGDWKSLETLTRDIAIKNDSVHVWAGNVGELEKIGKLSIPSKCWKVIYIVKNKEYQSYIFDNTPNKPIGLEKHKVTLKSVEELTGFKFD